jgi:hypothetical protein
MYNPETAQWAQLIFGQANLGGSSTHKAINPTDK